LFWTDQGATPKIERSNLDGTDRYTLIDKNIVKPTGITVDYVENQVFFIDDGSDQVRSN
jgi:low density lipoprotein receptor-related protein 5/6